jgi:hypothetical protein
MELALSGLKGCDVIAQGAALAKVGNNIHEAL